MAPASLPKGTCLYKVLELEKTATPAEIKSQYRKLALKFHPDKQPSTATPEEIQKSTEAFQQLGFAYAILSDPSKRSRYDLTGNTDLDDTLTGGQSWNDYFKELWTGVVNAETITTFAEKYRESEEERNDVLKYYKAHRGNMDLILSLVECSTAADGPRFATIIQNAINDKTVPEYPAFKKTTTALAHKKRIEKEQKEQAAFEKEKKAKDKTQASDKKENNAEASLQALIMARNQERQSKLGNLFDAIVDKHTATSKSKRSMHQALDDNEEEFQKQQARLMKKKQKKTAN